MSVSQRWIARDELSGHIVAVPDDSTFVVPEVPAGCVKSFVPEPGGKLVLPCFEPNPQPCPHLHYSDIQVLPPFGEPMAAVNDVGTRIMYRVDPAGHLYVASYAAKMHRGRLKDVTGAPAETHIAELVLAGNITPQRQCTCALLKDRKVYTVPPNTPSFPLGCYLWRVGTEIILSTALPGVAGVFHPEILPGHMAWHIDARGCIKTVAPEEGREETIAALARISE